MISLILVEHINITSKKASQRIEVLIRLRNFVTTTAKLQLLEAAVLPYLTYCHLAWHFRRASDKRKLERVQERGLRAVFKDSKSTYDQRLKQAPWYSMYDVQVKHDLCTHRIKNLFLVKSSTYSLRGAEFHIPRFNTVTHGKHSLRYLGPRLWNQLSTNLRNVPSLRSFKRQIHHINLSSKIEQECKTSVLCSSWLC